MAMATSQGASTAVEGDEKEAELVQEQQQWGHLKEGLPHFFFVDVAQM